MTQAAQAVVQKAQFVDRLAPQAEWRLVHRIADTAMPSVTRALHAAFWGPEDETTWGRVIDALQMSDAGWATYKVNMDALAERLQQKVWPLIVAVYARTNGMTARILPQREALMKRATKRLIMLRSTSAPLTNSYAQAWAAQNGARFVRDLTIETREAVRTFIEGALGQGIPPRRLAQQLREVVGLTTQQMGTLNRQRDRWIADGLSVDAVQRRIEFAYAKALRQRIETIVRTEALRASNAGQVDAWREARGDGLLDASLVKEWIVTPDDRLCPLCEPLDGEQVAIDAQFPGGVTEPPLHPNCRCAVGLERPA